MCVHMCLCQRNGEGIAACMCRSVCLWQQEKLEVFSSLLLKPLEREGRGNKRKKRKSHRYSKKEKCIVTLRASQWQCQLAKVSRKLS